MPAPASTYFLLFALSAATAAASADEHANSNAEAISLDEIVVVASRSERPLSEVAARVTVIDSGDIERALVEDLDSLFRYTPGIDVAQDGTRFGSTSVNINGIGGNRVLIELDGVPVRDQFAIGAYSNAGRDLLETDRIKRVEVLRGPASAMYGSDAIGGVIAIATWDPDDLLRRSDGDFYAGIRGGYQGSDSSHYVTAQSAFSGGNHGLLLSATRRKGNETDHAASSADDTQNWDSTDAMLRYRYDTSGGNAVHATISGLERDTTTTINSLLGYGRRFRNTTALAGDDSDHSTRTSVDFEFTTPGGYRGQVSAFHSQDRTHQFTSETRALASPAVDIYREFHYRQENTGVIFDAFREWAGSLARHRLGIGAQWQQTRTSELRDGRQTDLESGDSSNTILGEDFPVRDFPDSSSDEFGLFIQDEIEFGRLEIIPALRWDSYDLSPSADDIFREDNPDTAVVAIEDSRLTPRIGILYDAGENWTVYGQVSEGFRAPPFDDVNIGFDIPLFGYRALPNPDLKSETSRGFELGIRRIESDSSFDLSMFETDYDDFIESRALVGIDPVTGDLLFQSRNIDRARIHGANLNWEAGLGSWNDALQDWRFSLSAFWADGENRVSGEPLNSIAPPQAVTAIGWHPLGGRWAAYLHATFTSSKSAGEIDESDGKRFATPGWTTFDVTATWNPRPDLQFRLGVFNLADRTYWRWLDVAGLEADDPMIPLLSRPGRNLSVSARFEF